MAEESGACGSYNVIREGEDVVVRIDCEFCPFFPSIEDSSQTMSLVVGILAEVGGATKIILVQKRDYEYDFAQTQILVDLAKAYKKLNRQKLAYGLLSDASCSRFVEPKYAELQDILFHHLKADPIGAYVELLQISERENTMIKNKLIPEEGVKCLQGYYRLIEDIVGILQATQFIQLTLKYLPQYKFGDRDIYRKIISPLIKPDFMYTKLMSSYPADAEEIDSYSVGNTEVRIFKLQNSVQPFYHIIPPEFKLDEDKYEILDKARSALAKFEPKKGEFTDPERIRQVFFNIGEDMLLDLATNAGIKLKQKDLQELAEILVRYTVGFGLVEVLLEDEKIQDVTINSPMGRTSIFIVHSDHGDCATNIIPTYKEAESWASKLRIISGRPLDEANPILDTELTFPGARARIAAITSPLNPTGIAYSLRRHRDDPWTLGLFSQTKEKSEGKKKPGARYLNPLAAGLLSFLIDGNRTFLVAGTRSSGKTSLLGAMMVELSRKGRIITVEDSVTGDGEIIINRNGVVEKTQIGKLIDSLIDNNSCWYNLTGHEVAGNPQNVSVLSLDKNKKFIFSPVTKFIRHKVSKPIYEITTRTGRQIKVTGDHSLFTLGEEAEIKELQVKNIKAGNHLVTPRILNVFNKEREYFNLFDSLLNAEKCYFRGESINKLLIEHKSKIKQIAKENDICKSTIQSWFRNKILPARIVKDLSVLGVNVNQDNLIFKIGKSSIKMLPVKIKLTSELLTTMGCWIADGCYDEKSIIISATDEEDRKIVKDFAKSINFETKEHSDKWSLIINSRTLKWIFKEGFCLKGNSYTKRIPDWIFNLSLEQISQVLKGIYSGDGCVSKSEIVMYLASPQLLSDVQTLLLYYGITMRIGKKRKDGTIRSSISVLNSIQKFKNNIGILQNYKKERLNNLCSKKSTHDSTDIIPLSVETKKIMRKTFKKFNYNEYITQNRNLGRMKLNSLLQQTLVQQSKLIENLKMLSQSDIFFDEVREVKVILNYNDYVYDVSVPNCENFVCNNILAHNTLELPVDALRKLNYNIQSMKVASALTRGTTEVSADEGIRTTLRLGDSSLIVGEVRSLECRALYEAMRVGALANIVAGTIHGDSPYGVFDRVVNDLEVPRTSFKATDIIVIAKPIKTPGGLKRQKRVLQITEVRKHWEEDPLRENGFVDLMKYNPKTDELEPTSELLNGDSEVIKSIAGEVKDWAGNWEAVWENIQLRAELKKLLIEKGEKNPSLLEAPFVVQANDEFRRISDQAKEEVGSLDSKFILREWKKWFEKNAKKV